MNLFSFSRLFAKLGQRRLKRKPQRGGRRIAPRLSLELLEDRTLLSAAPIVTNPNPAFAAGFDPQVVMDPTNSQNLVEVSTTGSALVGEYSTNGGQTWNAFTISGTNLGNGTFSAAGTVLDPTTFDPGLNYGEDPYTVVTSPSVTFDRSGNFYIVSNQYNAVAQTMVASSAAELASGTNVALASGAIVFDEFNFAGNGMGPTETFTFGTSGISNQVLYQWYGQDPAFNPTVAVDANLPATLNGGPSFTDPVTGATQTDTMAVSISPTTGNVVADGTGVPKGIYVGWNINFTNPSFIGGASSRIMIAASGDGGVNFTTNQYADPSFFNSATYAATGVGSAPQILFTQGTTVAAGSNTITFTTSRMTVTAGQLSGTITIQATDANEVVFLSSDSGTGNFYYTSDGEVLPLRTTAGGTPYVITDVNGQASFLYEDSTPGTPTITAVSAATTTGSALQTEIITAGFANTITFTTSPMTVTAGQQTGTITILEQDAANAAVTKEVVYLKSSSGKGVFYSTTGVPLPKTAAGVPYVITDGTGRASFLYEDTAAGLPIITATDAANGESKTQTVTVNAAAVTSITFTSAAVSPAAGKQSGTITIQARRNGGGAVANEVVLLSTDSGTGTFYSSTTGAALPTTATGVPYVVTDNTGHAKFLYEDNTQGTPTITATDSAKPFPFVMGQQTENIQPATAATITFTTAATTSAAGQQTGAITILVTDNNAMPMPVTNEVVYLSSDSGTGTFYTTAGVPLPKTAGGVPYVITDGTGQAYFLYEDSPATPPTMPTITATDSGNNAVIGQQMETVNPDLDSAINFGTAITTNAGKQSSPITITVSGATSGQVVYLSSSSTTGTFYSPGVGGAPGVALPTVGGKPFVVTSGDTASFLYEDTAAGTPTLTATDAGNGTVGMQMETITAGASITFVTPVTTVTAGKQSTPITIQVKDENNNPVTNEVVLLSSSSGGGTFYSPSVNGAPGVALPTVGGVPYLITDGSGQASFLYVDRNGGTPTITAADAASNGVTKTQTEMVTAGVANTITFTPSSVTVTAGKQSGTITILVQDSANAAVTNEVVFLRSNSATGTFYSPGVGGAPGVALPTTAGGTAYVITDGTGHANFLYEDSPTTPPTTPTITATDSAVGSVTKSQQVSIQLGAAAAITISPPVRTTDPGLESGANTIQVTNNGGGVAKFEVVELTSDSPTGIFFDSADNVITSVVTNGSGQAIFFYEDSSPGTPTLTATDSAKPTVLGTQMETITSLGVPTVPGGQMNIVYTDDAGNAVIQQSQPDGGAVSHDVAATTTIQGQTGNIDDALPTPSGQSYNIPQTTTFTLNVTAADFPTDFAAIDDLEVTLDIVHPHMNQVSIVLTPPPGSTLARITLLANRNDQFGNTFNQGLPDLPNLGTLVLDVNNHNNVNNVGTVFDSDAPRGISDGTATTPWIGHFRPQFGSLNEVDGINPRGANAADVIGTWTLSITDYLNDGTITGPFPYQEVSGFSFHFSSLISTTGFGTGADAATFNGASTGDPSYNEHGATRNVGLVRVDPNTGFISSLGALTGSPSNVYPTNTPASGTPGTGPGIVAAIDNTLGSFSPYQGRIYIAYASNIYVGGVLVPNDSGIFLVHSDADGASNSWNDTNRNPPVQVNDDTVADNFSEGNREEFMPSIAVDPITGTVVIDYYDGRWDAAEARVANSISYSVDGGSDFSTSAPMNSLQTATDAITGATILVAPIPGNQGQAGTLGFGDRAGLVVYDGDVIPFFGSNLNTTGAEVMTADVTIPSGPTVVSGDMGTVVNDFTYQPTVYDSQYSSGPNGGYAPITYNNVFAADGTRLLSAFVVTFDRPVDISSFTASQIQVWFESPIGTRIEIPTADINISAKDNQTSFGPARVGLGVLATQFLISLVLPPSILANPVGTYSYAVGLDTTANALLNDPNKVPTPERALVSDDIRSVPSGIATNFAGLTENNDPYNNGATVLLGTYMNQNAGAYTNVTQVAGVNTTAPIASTDTPLSVPDGGATTTDTVAISDPYQQVRQDYYDPIEVRVDVATTSTVNLTLTLTSPLGTVVNLGTQTFTPRNGFATVIVADYNPYNSNQVHTPGSPLGALLNQTVNGNWVLSIRNSSGRTVTLNDWSLSLPLTTNVFAVPDPVNGVPFQLPYSNQTLPLIVPGPHVISTSVVSTGTYNTVSTYSTATDVQNGINISRNLDTIGVRLAPGENTTTAGTTTLPDGSEAPLLLPISDAFQIQQDPADQIQVNLNLTGAFGEFLEIQLVAQDGNSVTLFNGTVNSNTLAFNDFAPTGTVAPASFTGAPGTGLSALVNDTTAGDWQLVITNKGASTATLTVNNWSLQLPHTTTDNEALNGTANGILITFDRDMTTNAATLIVTNGLQLVGPLGLITGPFTLIADPPGTPMELAKRVFEITLPTQNLNGTYALAISPVLTTTTGSFAFKDTKGNAVDSNLNAGIDVLDGTNATNTVTTNLVRGVNPSPLNLSLPPNSVEQSTITISPADAHEILQQLPTENANGTFTAIPIQVKVDATIAQSSDLQLQLIAPDGTVIQLATNVAAGKQNPPTSGFQGTFFDDFPSENGASSVIVPQPVQEGPPPFAGQFQPQNPLSVLVGKSTAGTWTLRIVNTSGTDTGNLTDWVLTFPYAFSDTNLGEMYGDQINTGFRIFTQDPTNPLSQQQWAAVGPAADNNGANSGPVNAIAVDPSDPSGNTVYIGAATGGLWKTTNFLTTSPNGPTYVPLTNLGPTGSLNISSIAIFGFNNDPNQSRIFVMTGNPNNVTEPGDAGNPVNSVNDQSLGVGLLRSQDGGKTWQVLDSTTNVYNSTNDGGNQALDGTPLPENSASRDHLFVGLIGYKVVVDPTPLPGTPFRVVYAAFTDPLGANDPMGDRGGLYRSNDSGADWVLVQAGDATDVVLAAASADSHGNLQTLYAAFQGNADGTTGGVYGTTSATSASDGGLSLLAGGNGDQSIQNVDFGYKFPQTVAVSNDGNSPNGANGRIVLAAPALTSNTLENLAYQSWIYAAVANASGTGLVGLYVSKDFGLNWTSIQLPEYVTNGQLFGTNNTSRADINSLSDPNGEGGVANTALEQQIPGLIDLTLAVDPNNANVVYLGGGGNNLVRIDLSNLADNYAMVPYNNIAPGTDDTEFGSNAEAAAGNLAGAATVRTAGSTFGVYDIPPNATVGSLSNYPIEKGPTGSTGYYNMIRDPANPFDSSTLFVENTISINNQGFGALMGEVGTLQNSAGVSILSGSINLRALVAVRDPLTGATRLLVGDDNGVFTGAIQSENALQDNIGTAQEVTGSRNGNLQIAEFVDSAAQPSELAANLANALFYGDSFANNGVPSSTANILDTGNLNWSGENAQGSFLGDGESIATDASGTGQVYQYRWADSNAINLPPHTYIDFFLVSTTPGSYVARTFGLNPTNQAQWPPFGGSRFAVNPIDQAGSAGLVISSQTGAIYRSTGDTGQHWALRTFTPGGGPGALDSYANAVTFGAPQIPSVDTNPDDLIYAGTMGGHVYVTLGGGGTVGGANPGWVDLDFADLDGSPIEQIVADPRTGKYDLYVVTEGDGKTKGVYYMADSTGKTTPATWVNITGNLFSPTQMKSAADFNGGDQYATFTDITSLAVDWRFAVPTAVTGEPLAPVLYVGGNGGVFRSENGGASWSLYPQITETWTLAAPISATATTLMVSAGGPTPPAGSEFTITIGSELLLVTAVNGNTWTVVRGKGGTTAAMHGTSATVTFADSGLMPNLDVTSLSLATGNINPRSGLPNTTTGYNMLVAGTYGQGDYAIRLDNSAVQQYAQVNFGGLQVTTIAPVTPDGTTLTGFTATFNGPVFAETVKPADVKLYDPNGNLVAVAFAKDVTPTPPPGQPNEHNVYQFTFTSPQTAIGIYSVMISNASDEGGDKMAPYTGKLPFPYTVSEAVASFPVSVPSAGVVGGGIYGYRPATGFEQLLTTTASVLSINANGDIAAELPGYGVYRYTEATETWTQLTPANAALLAIDGAGNVYADLREAGVGIYKFTSPTNFKQLSKSDPTLMAVDAAGDLVADFTGYGLQELFVGNTNFTPLYSTDASQLAMDAAGDIFFDLPRYGVFRLLHGNNPASAQNLNPVDVSRLSADAAGDLAVQFPNYGIYRLASGTNNFVLLTGNFGASSLAIGGPAGDVFAEFPGGGVYRYTTAANAFAQITLQNGSLSAPAADSGNDGFAVVSGGGVYVNTLAAGWKQKNPVTPSLTAVNAEGDEAVDFPGYGVYILRHGASSFTQLTPASGGTLLTIDGYGDVFADLPTAGGIYEFPSVGGSRLLTPVNALSMSADAKGDLFAAFSNGGGVQELKAGSGSFTLLNGAGATLVAADAAGDLTVSFTDYGVYRLAAGANPSQFQRLNASVASHLAIDGNGDVYVEFAGYNGVYRYVTPSSFTEITTASVSVLTDDQAGDVFVDFANYGFFRYTSGIGWQLPIGAEGDASVLF